MAGRNEELFTGGSNNISSSSSSNNSNNGESAAPEPLRIRKNPASPPPSAQRSYYPPPASSSGSNPMAFPLPPGASSSANPLPFPDDDEHPFASNAGRPAGYHSPGDNDTSPRIGTGSPTDHRGPGLAERRAHVPKPIQNPSSPDLAGDELFAKPLRQPDHQQGGTTYNKKTYYPPPVPKDESPPRNVNRLASTASISTTRASRGSPPPPETPVDPATAGVNRFASTASTSTTRARRGSPPPPETPVDGSGGIEARYAASGISGTATLNGLQSAAATSRLAQYGGPPPSSNPANAPRRPWTPTESPGHTPHGPTTVYQGMAAIGQQGDNNVDQPRFSPPPSHPGMSNNPALQVSVLEQDFQRLGTSSPPPAYSSLNPGANGYPQEKRQQQQQQQRQHPLHQQQQQQQQPHPHHHNHPAVHGVPSPVSPTHGSASTPSPSSGNAPTPVQSRPQYQSPADVAAAAAPARHASVAAAGLASPGLQQQQHANHPAFAHDQRKEQEVHTQVQVHNQTMLAPQALASPPPLPEGWIAHLDQNSGQYYYIHLATQATQWEFPKGPNPLNHDPAPLSPVASTYGNPLASPLFGKTPMASPMFPPQTPGYAESIMSVAHSAAPTAFTVPPPSAGVDVYKVQPTNGVYFGPYLRYVNMDLENGIWYGSIMVATDAPQPPTIHIHLSVDLSPNPRQLIPRSIFTHQRWNFYKYEIDLRMGEHGTERWTYAVTSHLGCTRYEFVVAGRHEQSWRFIAHSGNDFSPNTSQNDRAKLGGVGVMWKDVLQKNVDCGGFHVQLGLGNQIYGDRLWKEMPALKQWLAMSGKDNRKAAQWTQRHEEDVAHAYFHYYTSHFDQPFLREAFAQIPHILQIDDHDIFDGFGSYPEYMQQSHMFQNIGRIALEMYLLFQHQTTLDILRTVNNDMDLFTVTGHGWHFVKYLGPAVVVVGPDCRSERNLTRVMAGPTYQGIFPKVAMLPPTVQHCIWMMAVPPLYPRLEAVESLGNAIATGKKAVNTTYNILGKVTSSVAGVVGGKEAVAQGFSHVKKAVGKGGLMGNVLNQFGDLDMAEILKDMWTHESKDLERTYLIRTLQGVAQQKGLRMTFLSGDVNCCGAAYVHDPSHPNDHKTMYQIITSPIVAQPTNSYLLRMLHNNKALYVPKNGQKSTHEVSDTKEDMIETFPAESTGTVREFKKLMGRRNYAIFWPYDPDAVAAASANGFVVQFGMDPAALVSSVAGLGIHGQGVNAVQQAQEHGLSKLNIAVAFAVQGEGGGGFAGTTTQYGPVVIPGLEYGH